MVIFYGVQYNFNYSHINKVDNKCDLLELNDVIFKIVGCCTLKIAAIPSCSTPRKCSPLRVWWIRPSILKPMYYIYLLVPSQMLYKHTFFSIQHEYLQPRTHMFNIRKYVPISNVHLVPFTPHGFLVCISACQCGPHYLL